MNYIHICFFVMGLLAFFSCEEAGNNEGKQLYKIHCANCHGDMGEGLEALNPPLAQSDMLAKAGAGVACWIRNGLQGDIVVNGQKYEHQMPPMPQLSAIEITNILNYVHNSWGNKHKFITLEEVNTVLESCDVSDGN